MNPIAKSRKLANVCYDIRGPVLDKAREMEEEGQKIIKLNIGNLAVFGLEPPDEIVQDMIRNLPHSAAYTDSKGLFAPRKAVVHYTQQKHVAGVTVDDVYLGNGASELIVMSVNALLNDGDEVLVPAPDYPLWTAAVSLSGGTPRHYVCDEGAGLTPQQVGELFQPFKRLTQAAEIPGTGLGLTVVKMLVGQMGGTIEVASEPGAGCRFTVCLRRVEAPAERNLEAAA